MTNIAESIIPITRPRRVFRSHKNPVTVVAVFPNGRQMVTGLRDKTICLSDLKFGEVLKKMEGHRSLVWAVAISGDGKLIASGDESGELIAWAGDTGESLTKVIKAHSQGIRSLDFCPDGAALATVSWDKTIKLWNTETWQIHGKPIHVGEGIYRVRYSPSCKLLAIVTTRYIRIYNPSTSECIAKLAADSVSLAWTPDGTRLFSGGYPTMREWDTSTWKQVAPWNGHTNAIYALAVDSTGTLLASACDDNHVRLWRVSDQTTIAVFTHSCPVSSVIFSPDGKYILCEGRDTTFTEWDIPKGVVLVDTPKEQTSILPLSNCLLTWLNETLPKDEHTSIEMLPEDTARTNNTPDHRYKILSISSTVYHACLTNNLSSAQELLTRQINLHRNNHNAYANRSFVFARKSDWDNALKDAIQSLSIQPSLIGYISKGIALCGKMEFNEATKAFDIAFMFTDQDLNTTHSILLIKAIALFNANQQPEAMQRIRELAAICPITDALACHVVEAYLLIQLGINALNDARHNEAVDYFTQAVAINSILSNGKVIHSKYEIFAILFGWNLASLWQIAHQNRCHAFLQAGQLIEAHEAYKCMMNVCDEATKTSCLEWSTDFKKQYHALCVPRAHAALAARDYDSAIKLYSAVIDFGAAANSIFANRCEAKLGGMLWEEALIDAEKVTELNPPYLGFRLKHAALHGAQRYSEAIEAFEVMLSELDGTDDPDIQALRQQYIPPSDARAAIQNVVDTHMEDTPPRLLDTSTGRLCDREAQISAFNTSPEYNELLSSIISFGDANLRMQRIQDVVAAFFSCVMLSHRWERKEPSLHEVQDKVIYELNAVEGITKLQSFCKIVQDSGYRWAWIDTCCIDQNNNVEVQRAVNSMFAWYRHSALTIIYLSDVPPSSISGAMARSIWNTRGWTVQEFLAPNIVLFYQNDWTLYLNDRTPNHKESAGIMRELEDATGISGWALTGFRPGMTGAREKLQWASMRVTTLPEDIAYSLFGLFGINLAVIYGEKKHKALGRLLQEIIAQSGDITCLDWVGESSEFNSCLPASITSFAASPFVLPSPSENQIHTSICLLRDARLVALASQLYTTLDHQTAPRFAQRRLHLPCIVFTVTEITRRPIQGQDTHFTYSVKANGLNDLCITTANKLIPLSRSAPIRQNLCLVHPWDRNLLELHDPVESSDLDYVQGATEDYQTPPSSPLYDPSDTSPGENQPVNSGSDLQALRLVVRLGQPFKAFLLVQQWSGEYMRVAADHTIVAQVKDMASVHELMDVRTLEIL